MCKLSDGRFSAHNQHCAHDQPNIGQSSQGQEEYLLYGEPTIRERINNFSFDISAKSFFQTNTRQSETPHQTIQRMAEIDENGIAVDLYCGTGSIALHLASRAKMVYGIELVEAEAVRNAEQNAERNHLSKCAVPLRRVRRVLPEVVPPEPDVMVVDPPRAGLSKSRQIYARSQSAADHLCFL